MITLYELVNNITIQGNVSVVPFNKDGDEIGRIYVDHTDDLANYDKFDEYEDWPVTFIYADRLGRLVIEVQEEE